MTTIVWWIRLAGQSGNLKTCYLIQSSEAMDHLSLIRLAADFKMMPEKYRALADRMFIEVQPGHVNLLPVNRLILLTAIILERICS